MNDKCKRICLDFNEVHSTLCTLAGSVLLSRCQFKDGYYCFTMSLGCQIYQGNKPSCWKKSQQDSSRLLFPHVATWLKNVFLLRVNKLPFLPRCSRWCFVFEQVMISDCVNHPKRRNWVACMREEKSRRNINCGLMSLYNFLPKHTVEFRKVTALVTSEAKEAAQLATTFEWFKNVLQ